MSQVKAYKGRYTGPQIDDLLGRVPEVEERVKTLEAGGGDKNYVHYQNNSSDVWDIRHNLGKHPSVTVVEYYSNEEIIADVVYVDDNRVIVRMKENLKGIAYLN